jgi:hypothetical protein
VVLNCWVTETNETSAASKISTIFAKSANDRVSRSTFVDHDHVDQVGLDVGQQPLKRWPFGRSSGKAAVIIEGGKGNPALVPLTLYICVTGLALGMQGVEILFQSLFG